MSITIQYIILGLILLFIAIRIGRKISCALKRKETGCCGCALSGTCRKKLGKSLEH